MDRSVFLTDVGGVLGGDGAPIRQLSAAGAESLIDEKIAVGGMEAKLRAAVGAVRNGIGHVSILNGHDRNVLVEAAEGGGRGTQLSLA